MVDGMCTLMSCNARVANERVQFPFAVEVCSSSSRCSRESHPQSYPSLCKWSPDCLPQELTCSWYSKRSDCPSRLQPKTPDLQMFEPFRSFLTVLPFHSCMACAWLGRAGSWLFLVLLAPMVLRYSSAARLALRGCGRIRHKTAVLAHGLSSLEAPAQGSNFVTQIVLEDLKAGKNGGKVVTRFPPEPNGYLHLGHAKAVLLNFGIASQFGGSCHMRMDDTNPSKENVGFVQSILDDVRWITTGSVASPDPWTGGVLHASDYFQTIYDAAEFLIQSNLAYVDHLSQADMESYRGTLLSPGKDSPYRDRSVEENLRLFRDMRAGRFADGHCVLRAKIDMQHPNIVMRDPVLFRIKHTSHHASGDKWCIYPMYDFAHAISDALESITHSLCSLEFKDHKAMYDWTVDNLLPSKLLPQSNSVDRPRQYEFSRLNLQYTVLSKRRLMALVEGGHVSGWDDPRMPTIAGLRRRGVPHEALQRFCERIGVTRVASVQELGLFDACVREVLDERTLRLFAIERPLKVTITNLPPGDRHEVQLDVHPHKAAGRKRTLYFERTLFIDRDDFHDSGEDGSLPPPRGFKRLLLGGTVKLKGAFVVQCNSVKRDPATGQVNELLCEYDPSSANNAPPQNMKKPKVIIQWLAKTQAAEAELRLYESLFAVPEPGGNGDFLADLRPESLVAVKGALVESNVRDLVDLSRLGDSRSGGFLPNVFQFEREGYFAVDLDSRLRQDQLVFNRVVTLKDGWKVSSEAPSIGAGDASSPSPSAAGRAHETKR